MDVSLVSQNVKESNQALHTCVHVPLEDKVGETLNSKVA